MWRRTRTDPVSARPCFGANDGTLFGCNQKLKEAVNDRFVLSVADDAAWKLGIRRIRDCAILAITSFITRYQKRSSWESPTQWLSAKRRKLGE
jgi:hypothetical protein